MPGQTYLTQFICICDRCDHETMAVEIDGYVTVDCVSCGNSRMFVRPDGRLSTGIVNGRLRGHFTVVDRFIRRPETT